MVAPLRADVTWFSDAAAFAPWRGRTKQTTSCPDEMSERAVAKPIVPVAPSKSTRMEGLAIYGKANQMVS